MLKYYEFSTGVSAGEDYKKFERKYISYLKTLCKENGRELVNVSKGHYENLKSMKRLRKPLTKKT